MNDRKSVNRPVDHLNELSRDRPGAWANVDMFRADRGKGLPQWPDWCFMPMAAWLAIASGGQTPGLNDLFNASRLAAIGAWRYSQGIYRFDEDALQAIADTVPSGEMPSEVLYRLPEWSVYIETPGLQYLGEDLHGFWAHLEWDVNTERHELRLLLDTQTFLVPVPMHLGKWTVTEAVDRAYAESRKQWHLTGLSDSILKAEPDAEAAARELYGLVSLLLYVCCEEPEIDDKREPGAFPAQSRPKRTKKGWRLFPAKRPRVWTVGETLGERLRSGPGELTGRGVDAHLRKAHWHGFWRGPRDGQRHFSYKWLPPIPVSSK
ncbi:hypothetical protein [Marinimicrobium sp. ABcell2]|uniref:AcrVA2 family anti-CRISPR protein n=1 Tax=Marinimicrobium sp. ABcell2 TaxID=3069751 RepID=UPI0027B69B4D|nr:hypothetical protein [Marinimicrobium sp. ABcell2]MDQ2077429.1 hypothetical protein [Marinimicrobium sp. ABcell2]